MSNTFLATVRHELVQKGKGKYHAGIVVESLVRTACGEEFAEATIVAPDRFAAILTNEPDRICKRCDRVGCSIADR